MTNDATTSLQPDPDNLLFSKAVAFVQQTHENIFITGKAGTGKTTFLKYISTHLKKRCAIVAPTGVAAINAGGETIHSFLQLPFSPFIPGSGGGFGRSTGAEDKHSLLANLRMRETKQSLLRKLDMLIIDEVSMVRCDLIDEIDLVLQHVRKKWHLPFGGVQMVFIGDLYQLPPVAQQEEWEILRNYYHSPYFFDAHVLRENAPLYIELDKVYRQKDPVFIALLNRVRAGQVLPEDIVLLNERYDPLPQKESGYIILSTHNRIADDINQERLGQLGGSMHTFTGTIKNEFNPKNLPTDEVLQLKAGAQVMLVKNDLQTPRRYYNGKVAIVSAINDAGIWVRFPGDANSNEILVEQETWRNMRYTLNTQKGVIEEEESGSFTQYPLRLAWAVTVHKSQGLTLEKVVVDLNQSFAPGQVYVALSRCTSLQGLVLRTPLVAENIITDWRVLDFAADAYELDELDAVLNEATRRAATELLCQAFAFDDLLAITEQQLPEIMKRKTGPREQNITLHTQLTDLLKTAQQHGQTFQAQIQQLADARQDAKLEERRLSAAMYFIGKVFAPCKDMIAAHLKLLETYPKVARQNLIWIRIQEQITQKEQEIANTKPLPVSAVIHP